MSRRNGSINSNEDYIYVTAIYAKVIDCISEYTQRNGGKETTFD